MTAPAAMLKVPSTQLTIDDNRRLLEQRCEKFDIDIARVLCHDTRQGKWEPPPPIPEQVARRAKGAADEAAMATVADDAAIAFR